MPPKPESNPWIAYLKEIAKKTNRSYWEVVKGKSVKEAYMKQKPK